MTMNTNNNKRHKNCTMMFLFICLSFPLSFCLFVRPFVRPSAFDVYASMKLLMFQSIRKFRSVQQLLTVSCICPTVRAFLVKHRGKLLHENCLNFIYWKLLYHFKHTMRILYVYIINLYRNAYTTIISLYAYNCLWFIYRYSIGYIHTNIYRIYGHLVTQFVWNFITTLIRNIWFQFNKFVGRKVSKEKIYYIKKTNMF